MKKTDVFAVLIISITWFSPRFLNIPDFIFKRWASSTIKVSKLDFSVSVNEPEPLNKLLMSAFPNIFFNFASNTARGAAFGVTYLTFSRWLVKRANALIEMTDLPVPGPPLIMSTRFCPVKDSLDALMIFSRTVFCSSSKTNSS